MLTSALRGLRIGGLSVSLAHGRALPSGLPRPFELHAEQQADITLEVCRLDRAAPPAAGEPCFTSPNWRAFRRPGGYDLEINWQQHDLPQFYCYLELRGDPVDRGRLWCTREADLDRVLDYPVDEVLYLHLLAPRGGIIIHAGCIVDGGYALVYPGHSGAGKTTLTRRWATEPDVTLLTDERGVLCVPSDPASRPVVYGSPWAGEGKVALDAHAPLGALLFLKQAPEDAWRPISASDAAARLLSCSFPPLWDERGTAAVLATLDEVVRRVPCYELGFLREGTCVPLLRARLDQLISR